MDGIIFDVDGTLWNSTDAVAKAWTKAIQENSDLDLIVDSPLLNRIFGKTMDAVSYTHLSHAAIPIRFAGL